MLIVRERVVMAGAKVGLPLVQFLWLGGKRKEKLIGTEVAHCPNDNNKSECMSEGIFLSIYFPKEICWAKRERDEDILITPNEYWLSPARMSGTYSQAAPLLACRLRISFLPSASPHFIPFPSRFPLHSPSPMRCCTRLAISNSSIYRGFSTAPILMLLVRLSF